MVILDNCCLWFKDQTAWKFACIHDRFILQSGMRLRLGCEKEEYKSQRFWGKLKSASGDSR